jgi:FixJ family two-component response regulator
MQQGAADFLQKPVRTRDLLASVKRVLSAEPDGKTSEEISKGAALVATLTPRERQVLRGVLDGKPNKIIAADLGISTRTAEHHRERVMRKTGAKSLARLIRMVR